MSDMAIPSPNIQEGEIMESGDEPISHQDNPDSAHRGRVLIGFWLLGLCNNFAYVVMLSAAHDILNDKSAHNVTNSSIIIPTEAPSNSSGKLIPDCNKIGTGVILLADILPGLVIKFTSPWYIQAVPYSLRVVIVSVLAAGSFPMVAFPTQIWLNLIGVAMASASSGLGELTFVSLTSHYHRDSVSTWSSGTGASGVFGALSYAGLTAAGLSPRTTIMMMVVVPVILAASYFFLIAPNMHQLPVTADPPTAPTQSLSEHSPLLDSNKNSPQELPIKYLPMRQKLALMKPLLKYMIPLMLVYFAEYFINQALFELIYFKNSWPPKNQQYRWYQTLYQFGVLISRSSVNCVKIQKIWVLALLQWVNIGILLLQIFYGFLPSIWLIFLIILYEGLLGGAAYVNTFYRITVEKTSIEEREFSMGIATLSDTTGIAISAIVSIPFHNFMCTL